MKNSIDDISSKIIDLTNKKINTNSLNEFYNVELNQRITNRNENNDEKIKFNFPNIDQLKPSEMINYNYIIDNSKNIDRTKFDILINQNKYYHMIDSIVAPFDSVTNVEEYISKNNYNIKENSFSDTIIQEYIEITLLEYGFLLQNFVINDMINGVINNYNFFVKNINDEWSVDELLFKFKFGKLKYTNTLNIIPYEFNDTLFEKISKHIIKNYNMLVNTQIGGFNHKFGSIVDLANKNFLNIKQNKDQRKIQLNNFLFFNHILFILNYPNSVKTEKYLFKQDIEKYYQQINELLLNIKDNDYLFLYHYVNLKIVKNLLEELKNNINNHIYFNMIDINYSLSLKKAIFIFVLFRPILDKIKLNK